MFSDHEYFLVVDFEATCADDGSVPKSEMEIIEVGAVLQSTRTFEIESEFQSFIRPQRHLELTDFCQNLTTIRQSDVNQAPIFPEVAQDISEWLRGIESFVFCSWGNFDRRQAERDAHYHQVVSPFGVEHINFKKSFAQMIGSNKQMGLGSALKHLGLGFEGTPHRGIDDARNVARIVQWLRAGG